MDVAPRAEIGRPEDAKRYLDLGVRNFSLGTDVGILSIYWKNNGVELKKLLSKT
jgi:hypothetical protein